MVQAYLARAKISVPALAQSENLPYGAKVSDPVRAPREAQVFLSRDPNTVHRL